MLNPLQKNSADDKLMFCMRRFVQACKEPPTVVLMSTDVNFASDLYTFKYTYGCTIKIIYQGRAHDSLLKCADAAYKFEFVTENIFELKVPKSQTVLLSARNLPQDMDDTAIRTRLSMLAENSSGKVIFLNKEQAIIKFPCVTSAFKGQQRMNNQSIGLNKIQVQMEGILKANLPLASNPETADSLNIQSTDFLRNILI